MRVILQQNIKGVGRIGEVKNVADGYGRNFLLARNLAKLATDTAIKETELLRRKEEMMNKIEENKAREIARTVKDMVIEIKRKASDKGTLFDGLEEVDIVEAINKKIPFELKKDMVKLKEPIKHIGKHIVELELTPEVKTQIELEIKNEP